jgi:hypothetical protein
MHFLWLSALRIGKISLSSAKMLRSPASKLFCLKRQSARVGIHDAAYPKQISQLLGDHAGSHVLEARQPANRWSIGNS